MVETELVSINQELLVGVVCANVQMDIHTLLLTKMIHVDH
jgi:hypothetical protein